MIDGFSFPTSDGSDGQVLKLMGMVNYPVTDGGSFEGFVGHYSETEISNLSPSVGDTDYTNQQLKMYVKGTSSDTTRYIKQIMDIIPLEI